jgi:uncharacterized membrane protein YgdD (TMEM256/DUF423 family)
LLSDSDDKKVQAYKEGVIAMTARTCILLGTILAGLAVVLGAFGAHALETKLPQWYSDPIVALKMASIWEVGVRYQLIHAVGLIALGLWGEQRKHRTVKVPALAFCLGIALFSGLLYALVLTGERKLGAIVPVGGTAFIVGWMLWGWLVFREEQDSAARNETAT